MSVEIQASIPTREQLFKLLGSLSISFERFSHPIANTCEELRSAVPDLPGAGVKNLLVGDLRKRVWFLLLVEHEKKVDLKRLGKELGLHLSFAPAETMLELLGVTPGSVTALGLFADTDRKLRVLMDGVLAIAPAYQFHPLQNDETIVVQREALTRFLDHTGHTLEVRELPAGP